MTVAFVSMPAARRTPGRYTEFNLRNATAGLRPLPILLLFIGQRLSTGTKAALSLDLVSASSVARDYYGRGSVLARMLDAAFAANPAMQAWAIALDDHGSGVAATKTITFSGTSADGDQVVSVWIGGQRVDLAIADGDTPAEVAAALADLLVVAENPDLPMTGADAGAVVTLTARNDGTLGQAIDVHVEFSGTGLAAAVANATSGATDPDLSTALALVEQQGFDFIVVANNDATNLALLETHLVNQVHPLVSLGGIGVAATCVAYATAATLAANFATTGWMTLGSFPSSPTWAPELAGAYGGALAAQPDPALPYNNVELPGVLPPWSGADRLLATEVETALWNGVSPFVIGAGNKARIVRAITTYTENEAGAADEALLDVTTSRTLLWLRAQVTGMLATKYSQAKNTATRRAAIRQDVIALLKAAESVEILENVDDLADGVIVEVNGSDPARCDVQIPANVVNGLHVVATRIDLLL